MVPIERIHGILAAPPCTMFSLARRTAKIPPDFEGAMKVVATCLNIIWRTRAHHDTRLKWWALENPRGLLRQFLGRPALYSEAWWYGDPLKKPTDLWGYFDIPRRKRGAEKPTYPRKGPGSWSYQNPTHCHPDRSRTPAGFAEAFFKANP